MSTPRGSIQVAGISKRFRIPQREQLTLKGRILHPFQRPSVLEFDALKNVSFDVAPGEFFGIIGRNGSGKSTLLKLVAGIYRPDSGSADVNGTIASFIELGVGFNMELTGRDNLFINGALLGLTRKEIKYRYDAIVDFAELHDFMDLKLRNYSSGMQVRLAFSVALQADADVLLTDEVLAVGDARFQEKCYDVFQERKRKGRTIVFVSHDMSAIQQFCDRVMLMERGEEVDTGPPPLIARKYLQINAIGSPEEREVVPETPEPQRETEQDNGAVRIVGAWCEGSDGTRVEAVRHGELVRACVQIEALRAQAAPVVGFAVRDALGQVMFGGTSAQLGVTVPALREGEHAVVGFEFTNELADGQFTLDCEVSSARDDDVIGAPLDNKRSIWRVESSGTPRSEGVFAPKIKCAAALLDSEAPAAAGAATPFVVLLTAMAPEPGLLAWDPDADVVEWVDTLPGAGLDVAGGRVHRLLQPAGSEIGAEIVEYDRDGVHRVTGVPAVVEALDVHVGTSGVYVLAPGSNSIVTLGSHGGADRTWSAGGAGDAWRLTSVSERDGEQYATAFGRYDRHREWTEHPDEPNGVIVRLSDRATVRDGLVYPYSLTALDDGWLLGEAGSGCLIELDSEFAERRRLDLGGWVRGISVHDGVAYVGVAGMRTPPGHSTTPAELVRVDLTAWRELGRTTTPVRDVYSVAAAPRGVVERVALNDTLRDLRTRLGMVTLSSDATGRYLEHHEMRTAIAAELEEADWRGSSASFPCTVTNLGPIPLATALPHPVQLGYRWTDPAGVHLSEGRQPLDSVIQPGASITQQLHVLRPKDVDRATLTVSLLLESVAWFADVDPSNGFQRAIDFRELAALGSERGRGGRDVER